MKKLEAVEEWLHNTLLPSDANDMIEELRMEPIPTKLIDELFEAATLPHYLTPSDVDYYMNNEINNRDYGQTGEKRTTTEPLRSEDTVTTI